MGTASNPQFLPPDLVEGLMREWRHIGPVNLNPDEYTILELAALLAKAQTWQSLKCYLKTTAAARISRAKLG